MPQLSVRTVPSQDSVFVINPVKLFCIAVEELKVSKQTRLTLPNKTWRNKAEAPAIDTFDDAELPAHYNSTYLTFIARDPYCIHAYWEIAPERLENLLVKLAKNQQAYAYVLRLYDVTRIEFDGNNANHCFDVEIDLLSKHHYVDLWCDNVSYCGEIGLLNANGDFVAITRSNFVTTPPASLATDSDVLWGELPADATPESQMIVQTSSLCSSNDEADSATVQTPDGLFQASVNTEGPVSIDWPVESSQWVTMGNEPELAATLPCGEFDSENTDFIGPSVIPVQPSFSPLPKGKLDTLDKEQFNKPDIQVYREQFLAILHSLILNQTLLYRPPMPSVSPNNDKKPSTPQQAKLAFGGSSDVFYSRDINK